MRNILFRGKRKSDGRWVYGYLVCGKEFLGDETRAVIVEENTPLFPNSDITAYTEVIPETVGQYIGVVDVCGERIFEGDILEGPSPYKERCYLRDIRVFDLIITTYKIIGNVYDHA